MTSSYPLSNNGKRQSEREGLTAVNWARFTMYHIDVSHFCVKSQFPAPPQFLSWSYCKYWNLVFPNSSLPNTYISKIDPQSDGQTCACNMHINFLLFCRCEVTECWRRRWEIRNSIKLGQAVMINSLLCPI